MRPFISAVFFSLLIISNVYCTLTTEYYENLISQRLSKAANYQLPQNNVEFKLGLESSQITDFGSYDFIIVGAGTAGSVLATRLSEISKWTILLLEAGDDEDDFSLIPGIYPYLQFSEKNWGYMTTPQKNSCLGMKGKRCMASQGKSIGGTSAINAVQYVRSNPRDYDKWVELGNPGWSYEEVLPYFIKSENSQIDDGVFGYHGTGGIWNVEHPSPVPPQMINFFEAHAELNLTNIDYNSRKQIGATRNQINIKRGKRQGTGTAFLDYARNRKNLKIVTKAMVTKINIDVNTKTAEGVEFVTDKAKFRAKARMEVILSAGVINSPKLLILSGIGPKDHLEELNIDVIANLPVGENLRDHTQLTGLNFRTNYTHPRENLTELIEQFLKGFGPLTVPSNLHGYGFISTKNSPPDVPMIEYTFSPPHGITLPSRTPSVLLSYNDEELVSKYFSKLNPKTDIGFLVILLHQKSIGRITLKSNNPIDFPNIDSNINSEPEDIDNIIEGIEFVIKLTQTEAFQRLNTTLIDYPICEELDKYSKEFWSCMIRHFSRTCYHFTSTTSMGPDNSTSVVDHNLKVHGIEKLRVVDAGVIPTTISGAPYATIVMIAEKISDVIRADHLARKE